MTLDEYIDIQKDDIPYEFEVDLGGLFRFEIHYNEQFGFFTVDLFIDDEPLVVGEKLILNRPLFRNYTNNLLPDVLLVPLDLSEEAKQITWENFNETVFLYIVRDDDE